jgi:hypothetical protein
LYTEHVTPAAFVKPTEKLPDTDFGYVTTTTVGPASASPVLVTVTAEETTWLGASGSGGAVIATVGFGPVIAPAGAAPGPTSAEPTRPVIASDRPHHARTRARWLMLNIDSPRGPTRPWYFGGNRTV